MAMDSNGRLGRKHVDMRRLAAVTARFRNIGSGPEQLSSVTDPTVPNDGEPMLPDARHRIVTAASVWIVERGTYVRMPRSEGPRPPITDATDGSLIDAQRHDHRGGQWEWSAQGLRLRLYPAHRPATTAGVLTGLILSLDGRPVPNG